MQERLIGMSLDRRHRNHPASSGSGPSDAEVESGHALPLHPKGHRVFDP
jgi:hypothetical protein